MAKKIPSLVLLSAILIAGILCLSGCGEKPPVPYQQLQVQDMDETQGWDIYMYIAVTPGKSEEEITQLLEWFRDVKYAEVNRIQIQVWDNPQSALISAMGDMVATLKVDRENEIDKIDIFIRNE